MAKLNLLRGKINDAMYVTIFNRSRGHRIAR